MGFSSAFPKKCTITVVVQQVKFRSLKTFKNLKKSVVIAEYCNLCVIFLEKNKKSIVYALFDKVSKNDPEIREIRYQKEDNMGFSSGFPK